MLVISHRGNLTGSDPNLENKPSHIDFCITSWSMNIEVDLWVVDKGLFLGHDEPQYKINSKWLEIRCNFLWIHCKNIEALGFCQNYPWDHAVNYFWHENDQYTLTSKGYIWANLNCDVVLPSRAITVLPELNDINLNKFYGVCTDFPLEYKNYAYERSNSNGRRRVEILESRLRGS